jgi:pimeloyl-ACP methyl ester carboxylesterase
VVGLRHLIALLLAASVTGTAPHQAAASTHAAFTIVYRGERAGRADVTVDRTAEGWRITSSSYLTAPVSLNLSAFDVQYTADWQPLTMKADGSVQGQVFSTTMTFGATTATGEASQGGKITPLAHKVSARAIVLPNLFYAGYAAFAARLAAAQPRDTFPIYLAQPSEITATFDSVTRKRIRTPDGTIDIRACNVTFNNPGGGLAVEIWIDAANGLARVSIPAQSLIVMRDDISSPMAREEAVRNPGDEDVFIPAAGFTIAATITRAAGATPANPAPAVVLIGGADPVDRDETIAGAPIFGQLAGELAGAGFLVVRYDKRGIGQSGGRVESATLEDYAGDAGSVVVWLRKRKDVDRSRIAVIGHGEGGAEAMIAGQRFKSEVAAIGLVGTSGFAGRELTLLQQAHALQKLNELEAAKQAKIALQQRILNAVVTGAGWESIPRNLRSQADTPWFKSWLTFDPSAAIARLRQPILIVQGSLDMQVFAESAGLLQKFARTRKNAPAEATRAVIVPGVNHALLPATTGDVDEYPSLPSRTVSPAVVSAITDWLNAVIGPARSRTRGAQ